MNTYHSIVELDQDSGGRLGVDQDGHQHPCGQQYGFLMQLGLDEEIDPLAGV